ncbi:MAG: substrate-binding domain-containing protein [Proteobacteria bacterium]|nr:substrate-binding domain-containing protein [Pseudomonadota bacterium]
MNKKRRDQPARMSDIARIAGVSASTVSRALAGSTLVAAAKRDEIRRLARERGYVINTTARNLRLQRTQSISVAIPLGHEAGQSLADPFLTEMIGHVADRITQRGYGMFLQKIVPPMDDWLPQLIGSHRSDGIIVIGQSTEHAVLEAAAEAYRPLVVWGGRLARQSYCTVGTDNVAGARSAVEHLIQAGRRRIVFLGDPAVPEIGLRYQGYLLAHERAAQQVVPAQVVPAHLTADTAYEAMRAFIGAAGGPGAAGAFDAVFGATDVIALSAVRAITAAGLSVPGDVAVVGYDDIVMASHANPPLSTVRQDVQRGAHMLVDLLFRRMEGEDTPSATMPADLVIRESSA